MKILGRFEPYDEDDATYCGFEEGTPRIPYIEVYKGKLRGHDFDEFLVEHPCGTKYTIMSRSHEECVCEPWSTYGTYEEAKVAFDKCVENLKARSEEV